jgi:MYXO-CTERM domain-containing protein
MVGLRPVVAGVVVAVASLGTTARAVACTPTLPPPALKGYPAPDERDVPTDAVPIFSLFGAGILNEQNLSLTEIDVADASGATLAVTPRLAFSSQFELVPERSLEPSTLYTIQGTPPAQTTGQPATLSLSFTTGSGPLSVRPTPPDARIQHYHSTGGDMSSSCDPSPDGSCVFFSSGVAVELSHAEDPSDYRYLLFGAWWENLSGLNQGTPWSCATLRTRAANGSMSGPIDVCRGDGEHFTLPDTVRLECTDRGLVKDGIPLDGSGGSATGGTGGVGTGGAATGGSTMGGSTTGGSEMGGNGTGGGGNSAAAPDDESDSRTLVTEGCGCRVPGSAGRSGSAAWLALGVAMLAASRRRLAARPSVDN